MTPTQRRAAERLVEGPRTSSVLWGRAVIALLRELLAAEQVQKPDGCLHDETGDFEPSHKPWMDDDEEWVPLYAAPQQPMRCPEDGGACGAGGYCRPEQRKPLTPSMQAEVECDCLVAWNASTYGHSAQDTVHPMFLSAFISGYRAAERAHGITGEPT